MDGIYMNLILLLSKKNFLKFKTFEKYKWQTGTHFGRDQLVICQESCQDALS